MNPDDGHQGLVVRVDDLSILLNIAAAARAKRMIGDSDWHAREAISRCDAALAGIREPVPSTPFDPWAPKNGPFVARTWCSVPGCDGYTAINRSAAVRRVKIRLHQRRAHGLALLVCMRAHGHGRA